MKIFIILGHFLESIRCNPILFANNLPNIFDISNLNQIDSATHLPLVIELEDDTYKNIYEETVTLSSQEESSNEYYSFTSSEEICLSI